MTARTKQDWPPFQLTRTAVEYTQRARQTLARAVRAGALASAGRNGRSMVFRREDLDAWLIGNSNEPAARTKTRAPRAAVSRAGSSSGDALERLASIRRGGR